MKKRLKADYKRLKKLAQQEPVLFTRVAELELELGKPKQARNRLTEALKQYANNATGHLLLARAQQLLGDREAALASYEDTIRLDPLNRRARREYADLLHELGHTEQEKKARTELYELDPTNEANAQAQRAMLLNTLKQLNGDDQAWDERWHPGDFTPHGAISRETVRELELGPTPVPIPPEMEPEYDNKALTQMLARLPMGGIDTEPPSSPPQPEMPDVEPIAADPEIPDLPLEDDFETAAAPDEDTAAETGFETIEDDFDVGEVAVDPEPVAEEPPLVEPEPEPVPDPEPEVEPEPEPVQDPEPEVEPEPEPETEQPSELEKALLLAEQPLDEFFDFEKLLVALKEDVPPLVDPPVVEESVSHKPEPKPAPAPPPEQPEAEPVDDSEPEPEPAPETESTPPTEPEPPKKDRGALSQDALDDLLASFSQAEDDSPGEIDDTPDVATETHAGPDTDELPDAPSDDDAEVSSSPVFGSQDDLDALIQQFTTGRSEDTPESTVDVDESTSSDEAADDGAEQELEDNLPGDDEVLEAENDTTPDEPTSGDQVDELRQQIDSLDAEPDPAAESATGTDMAQDQDDDQRDERADADATVDSEPGELTPAGSESTESPAFPSEPPPPPFEPELTVPGETELDVPDDLELGDDEPAPFESEQADVDPPPVPPVSEPARGAFKSTAQWPEEAPDESTGDEPSKAESDPAQPGEHTSPAETPFPAPDRPVPPPPRPRAQPQEPSPEDETPPDEYRGPVSKTLIRLQIQQGKLDHARAMLAKFRRQHPDDAAADELQAQLDQSS